jgi:dipeptidyl aminopeptidase/acylaminoacyl peptidase
MQRPHYRLLFAAVLLAVPYPVQSQHAAPEPVLVDAIRARELYVSNRLEDHDPNRDHARDQHYKAITDSIYASWSPAAYDFEKVLYSSAIDGLSIPAYLFRPTGSDAADKRPVLVWVHGGVHGDWGAGYLPFVIAAVSRGYIVIAPDYRGSTGYGEEFHDAIDYGGYEVDDVVSAVDFLRENVPEADLDRMAIMGWSHGGLIASLAVFRNSHPFRAAVAMVPVSNLVFRLSYKGPTYQALFSTQARIGGLPHERPDVYIARSPVYHVDRLQVPLLVHVATNDEDVDFVEAEMFLHALQVKQPSLAETKVYERPPGGHTFNRLVDGNLRVIETPELRDSWNRTWEFLERNLKVD